MSADGTTLHDTYIELIGKYHNSAPKLMIGKQITAPLAEKNPLTSQFWSRFAKHLKGTDDTLIRALMYELICHIANALDNKNFAEWLSANQQEQRQAFQAIYEKIRQVENSLKVVPASALTVDKSCSSQGLLGLKQGQFAFLTRWGEAKKETSLYDVYSKDLMPLKRDLALALNELNTPSYEGALATPPAKNTKNPLKAALITELIVFFEKLKPSVSRQLIIDLCHIFDFTDTDDEDVKNAQRRKNNLLKQLYNS